jgi:hypothetical protein
MEGMEVCEPREIQIGGLRGSGRLKQKWTRVALSTCRERRPGVEQERLRALDVVERSDLGCRKKIESVVEETCFAFDLRRSQCSLRAACRLGA